MSKKIFFALFILNQIKKKLNLSISYFSPKKTFIKLIIVCPINFYDWKLLKFPFFPSLKST